MRKGDTIMKKYNVCIVGGGSTYTLGFLKSFARMQEEFPLNKLVLFDIDGERQKPIGQYGDIMFAERYPELDFSYTTDPTMGQVLQCAFYCQSRY